MINKILHTLSNRTIFMSPVFPAISTFRPSELSEDTEAVRKLMGLDVSSHDYNLVGILQAVDAFPDILQEFGEGVRSYSLRDYKTPATSISGAELGPGAEGLPRIYRVGSEWPTFYEVTVSYLNATHVRVSGGEHNDPVPILNAPAGDLHFAWPEWTGVTGVLTRLENSWSSGDIIRVPVWPVRFPYAQLATALKEDARAYAMRIAIGAEGPFFSARSPIEKVAISALALSRSHPQFYA
jgi:hypothetical protein